MLKNRNNIYSFDSLHNLCIGPYMLLDTHMGV